MKRLSTTLFFVLLSVTVFAQSDPLNSAYAPSIDTDCTNSQYASNVWMTDTMQKVRQDAGSPASNACYLTAHGTQNEFVDFQVHVNASAGPISNLSVTTSDFVQTAPTVHTISAASTDVVVYREGYINITTKSSTANTFYNAYGYYPDALIPAVDPYFGQTTNAWPFTVAEGKNQSAWIDVHIPPAAPAGYYVGSVTVKSGSTTLATMPVILVVWQWPSKGYMPSTSSLPTDFSWGATDFCQVVYGGYSGCAAYPGATNSTVGNTMTAVAGAQLMLDHRISMYNPLNVGGTTISLYENSWAGNGTPATILPHARPTGVNYYSNYSGGLSAWDTLWNTNASNWAPAFTYNYCINGCDEPGTPAAWNTVASSAATAHALTPPLPVLVDTYLSKATTNNALNNIDIMVVNNVCLEGVPWSCDNNSSSYTSLKRSSYDTWLAGNSSGIKRQIWSYIACGNNGNCSNSRVGANPFNYPNYDIDALPAANRAQEWMTFFHQQTGELYYYTTCAWETGCGGSGLNPWTNQHAFGNNGDGTLLYPSTFNGTNWVTAPSGTALTTPLWIPSIRVKHIRDGMQDYEYLNVLTNNGQGSAVSKQIASWITNSYTFETSGKGLQAARTALGAAMHQSSYPLSTPAAMISPTPGSTLSGSITFTWSPGIGVTQYALVVGTTLNGSNLYNSGQTTATSSALVTIPASGLPIYARLYSLINGVWSATNYTYTAAGAATLAILRTPTPYSTVTTASTNFAWSAGVGVSQYDIRVGTTLNANDLYESGHTTATSSPLVTLPTGGQTIYVRLYSLIGFTWWATNYTFVGPQ